MPGKLEDAQYHSSSSSISQRDNANGFSCLVTSIPGTSSSK
ncbi:hypothetical protein X975_26274, partial [Stegodyphus mimosarum]